MQKTDKESMKQQLQELEAKLDEAERRHDIRYHVQQYFIPEMVECVMDGYLPFIALVPSAQWLSNLRMDYELEDLKAAKVWESFE